MTGIVRDHEVKPRVYENMPEWMQIVCTHTRAYVSFWQDLTQSIVRCESQIADLFAKGEDRKAAIMAGKRDTLMEMRHILEAYKKEEDENGPDNRQHASTN